MYWLKERIFHSVGMFPMQALRELNRFCSPINLTKLKVTCLPWTLNNIKNYFNGNKNTYLVNKKNNNSNVGASSILESLCFTRFFSVLPLEGNVDVDKLGTFLENMGIKTTEKELMDLTERLPRDGEYCNHPDILQEVLTLLNFKNRISPSSLSRHQGCVKS